MKTQFAITTLTELRADFWREHAHLKCITYPNGSPLPQNYQPADTRAAFVDYVDQLARSGSVSNSLAQRATL